jgi:hypothetical protein
MKLTTSKGWRMKVRSGGNIAIVDRGRRGKGIGIGINPRHPGNTVSVVHLSQAEAVKLSARILELAGKGTVAK